MKRRVVRWEEACESTTNPDSTRGYACGQASFSRSRSLSRLGHRTRRRRTRKRPTIRSSWPRGTFRSGRRPESGGPFSRARLPRSRRAMACAPRGRRSDHRGSDGGRQRLPGRNLRGRRGSDLGTGGTVTTSGTHRASDPQAGAASRLQGERPHAMEGASARPLDPAPVGIRVAGTGGCTIEGTAGPGCSTRRLFRRRRSWHLPHPDLLLGSRRLLSRNQSPPRRPPPRGRRICRL